MKGVLLLLLVAGCATQVAKQEKASIPKPVSFPIVVDSHPGHVRRVVLPKTPRTLFCGTKKVSLHQQDGKAEFWFAPNYFTNEKTISCFGDLGDTRQELVRFNVRKYDFPAEKLNVSRKKVFLSKKALRRVLRERAILKKTYASGSKVRLYTGPFQRPITSFITSYYGTKRIFNNKKRGQHLGTDFRARVGTPVFSANDANVLFVGDLFYTGNTVILDHGGGLFSVYAHLEKSRVKQGTPIKRGDLVGLAGMTGRVTGPHLHWGVKLYGEWIDGLSLVEHSADITAPQAPIDQLAGDKGQDENSSSTGSSAEWVQAFINLAVQGARIFFASK